jgi:hypothetical protein
MGENLLSAQRKGLDLKFCNSSAWVSTDPALAYSIISNLVGNAIRYTVRGRILVGTRRCGTQVRIEVWDSGIGIPEPELPRVFRDFYQVGQSRSARGWGMGLALVRKMAHLIGCPVAVRSVSGKGARFAVWLRAAQPRMLKADWVEQEECFQRKTVVLLDRDASTLERTLKLLSHWGFAVKPLTIDAAAAQPVPSFEEPLDLLIASVPKQIVESDARTIESLRHRYRPVFSLLILDDNDSSDADIVTGLRAKGFHIFYRPMPPWRLRMILLRLLSVP